MAGKASPPLTLFHHPECFALSALFTERGTTCMSFQVIKVDILLGTSFYLWTKMAYCSEVLTVPRFQMNNNIVINKYKRYKWMQSPILYLNKVLKSFLGSLCNSA